MRLEIWKQDVNPARPWRGLAIAGFVGAALVTTTAPGQFIENSEIIHEFRGENQGDQHAEERFKELGEAYEALSDPDRRAAYDRFGHAAFAPS